MKTATRKSFGLQVKGETLGNFGDERISEELECDYKYS